MKNYNPVIVEIFKEYDLDIGSIITAPTGAIDKTKLTYSCICGNDVSRSWRGVKTKPLCDDCMPRKKIGPKKNISKVVNYLAEKGYEMVDESEYDNEKKKIRIRKIGQTDNVKYMTLANFKRTSGRTREEANDDKKLSIAEVKKRVKDAGFTWIDGTEYVNNATKISIICHCDREFEVSMSNIKDDRVGCPKCYLYNRKYPWDYIEGVADKMGCTIITPHENYRGRDTFLEVLCACGEWMVKTVRGFLASPRCKQCSQLIREKTNLEKYGATNYFASEFGKDVIKAHFMEKYGISHNMQLKSIQQKAQQTCLKNHGVKCVLVTKEVREKMTAAHIKKWGDTSGNTLKIHMMKKYGVEHALQNAEIFMRQQKSAYKLKPYIFPSGNSVGVRGYEWMCLNDLISIGIDDIIPTGIDESDISVDITKMPVINYQFAVDGCIKEKRYFMDIHIKSIDLGIEVKSDWTYSQSIKQNKAKWIAASFKCKSGIVILVYNKNGTRVCYFRILNGQIQEEGYRYGEKLPIVNIMGEFK